MRWVLALALMLMLFSGPALAKNGPAGDMRSVDVGILAGVPSGWFQPTACAHDPGENIYVAIGSADRVVFKIPRKLYQRAIPVGYAMTQSATGGAEMTINKAAGCAELPLNLSRLFLSPPQDLPASGIVFTVMAGLHDKELTALRDSGKCAIAAPGFLKCSGRQTVNGTRQAIDYFMAKQDVQASGGPLRVRCQSVKEQTVCVMMDKMTDDTNYETTLQGAPTLESLRALHQAMEGVIDGFRVGNSGAAAFPAPQKSAIP